MRMTSIMNVVVMRCLAVLMLLATAGGVGAAANSPDGEIDWPMHQDPDIAGPPIQRMYHPRLIELWSWALEQPDAETRRRAADAIREVAQDGMPGVEQFGDKLVVRLASEGHPVVQLAVAEAIVELDVREAAPLFRSTNEQAEGAQPGIILVTDPALARWNVKAMRSTWMDRVEGDVGRVAKISAMQSLAAVGHVEALPTLRTIVANRNEPPDVRLAAGHAIGTLTTEGEARAAGRLAQGSVVDQLAAVAVLGSHESPDAVAVLQTLAVADEPAVAAAALARLIEVDPLHAASFAAEASRRNDARVRLLAAEVLRARQTPDAVVAIALLLDDTDPTVREAVRRWLIELDAVDGLSSIVRSETLKALARESWRGLEQAARVLGAIDEERAGERLIELLSHWRGEVRVSAATGLRWLAVDSLLPAMLEKSQRISELQKLTPDDLEAAMDRVDFDMSDLDDQQAQLMQAFGRMGYREAESLMNAHIPKNSGYGTTSRGAAIWALGLFYADNVNAGLVGQFRGRLSDVNPMEPEATIVRQFSAIGLGRMKAERGLSTLRKFEQEGSSSREIGGSCRWAIMQITGQTLPPLETMRPRRGGWFLEPTDELELDEYVPGPIETRD